MSKEIIATHQVQESNVENVFYPEHKQVYMVLTALFLCKETITIPIKFSLNLLFSNSLRHIQNPKTIEMFIENNKRWVCINSKVIVPLEKTEG